MGTPLGPKYIPYTYMDPLGKPWGTVTPPTMRGHVWNMPPYSDMKSCRHYDSGTRGVHRAHLGFRGSAEIYGTVYTWCSMWGEM